MQKFTKRELDFINSLNCPVVHIDNELINSIINKIILNKDYDYLIYLLNALYDFAEIPQDIVNNLISNNDKKGISIFLDNEKELYFLSKKEVDKLKEFLNVKEAYFKLDKSYDYYYNILFKEGLRQQKPIKINNDIIEYTYYRYNKPIGIKIFDIKDIGLIVSYVNYLNYNLTIEEQIIKVIDYLNEFGFNITKDSILIDKPFI